MKNIILAILVLIGLSVFAVAFSSESGMFILSMTSNGQRVLPLGKDGQVLTSDSSKPSGLNWTNPAKLINPSDILLVPGIYTLTNQPSAISEVDNSFRTQYDLSNSSKARLVGFVVSPGTGTIGVQYATGGSWNWLDGSVDKTTSTQDNTLPLDQKGLTTSRWFAIAPEALDDVKLRVMGVGGNGAASPQISNLRLQIK